MTALVYPTSLPVPSRVPRRAAERRGLSTGPGPMQARAKSRDWLADHDLEFVYSPAEMAIFKDWWQDTLQYGGAWFAAHGWPSADPSVGGVYQFKGGVRTAHRGEGNQRIQAVAQERGRGVDPQMVVCFYENFTAGLGPYAGNGLARFEIVSSAYGSALRYLGGTSVVDYNIARAAVVEFASLRAKLMVESASFDNAATLYLKAGSDIVAYVRPREDTFVDGANRIAIAVGSASYEHVGASALAIGVWYELVLNTNGAYTITRLDNDSVFASGSITAAAEPSYAVDSLLFVEDSDGGSTATQFADIEICPP
jgi:hypothetical protein